ncbi:MAG: nucleoside triphosphate pyrophosphohydrolase [Syntrophales bacterium]
MNKEPECSQSANRPLLAFLKLLEIVRRLRSPEDGCPWDIRQTKEDVGRYLLEEAYEVIDAVHGGSAKALEEELGDLLFQILFIARICEEAGEFDICDVIECISAKMIRRHDHVFGKRKAIDIQEVKSNWERIKSEVEGKGDGGGRFNRIPASFPALMRAQKVTEEAAKVGFDWPDIGGILSKIDEELAEFREAMKSGQKEGLRDEVGDLLLSMVNLGRFVGIQAEEALRSSINKFIYRFEYIEKKLRDEGKKPGGVSLEEMDRLWNESKGACPS